MWWPLMLLKCSIFPTVKTLASMLTCASIKVCEMLDKDKFYGTHCTQITFYTHETTLLYIVGTNKIVHGYTHFC